MKKIEYLEAKTLVDRGEIVVCKWGPYDDQKENVHTLSRLRYLHDISKGGIWKAEFFLIPKKNVTFSESEMEISFDEAYEMLAGNEVVYSKDEDGNEEEISSVSDLLDLRRHSEFSGEKLILYWRE